ncbi:MAG: transcriptional regulator, LuxR family [Tardiphaga sp.]|uniref:helix-turn-helix transcriptional regulator n=1 Tax=Tardiphaga sp. TaxID=1926292 RepID=UPI0026172720|nr:LuxR family transcriptional regulator [Tardiphaga sp.]MDB5502036.1 transcriptional regulator, LuxR family [Tardiphaga sp.]
MSEPGKRHFQIAMDAIDELENTTSAGEAVDTVGRAVAHFGLEHFCCLMPRNSQRPTFDACVLMTRWPRDWFDLYRRSDFQQHDPIVRYTRTQLRATSWSEALVSNDRVGRSVMEIAAVDFGLRAGISVPIHGINNYQAGVSFAGLQIDASKDAKSAVELIAIYAFNRLNQFQVAAPARPKVLTPRQREILSWTANGKTAWDTGQILGVSEDNVHKLIASAVARLEATNRTHAVVKAIRLKEIDL